MINLQSKHWLLGASIAMLIYIVTALALLWREPPAASAENPGIGGIEIGLGPSGGISGAAETVEQAEAEIEQQVVEPEPEPDIEPESEPLPAPEPQPEPDPEPAPDPEPIVELAPEPPPTEEPEPTAQQEPMQTKPPTLAGLSGQSGTQEGEQFGQGDQTAGGGLIGQTADYTLLLQTWLEKHKEYPRRARRRRQEGIAMIYFVVDRQGEVLTYRLEQSSGYKLLDEEVLAMIERAQPLPKMPDSIAQSSLELIVPVQFELR